MPTQRLRRSRRGNAVAELPVALWFFFLMLAFPIIGYATLWYRATLVFFGVRDCTYQASKQQTYSQAVTKAQQVLAQDSASWTGITLTSATSPTVYIVVSDPTTTPPTETEQTTPITTYDNTKMYMIRTRCSFSVAPIVNMGFGGSNWVNIPGLTGPMPMDFTYQVFAENPQGLTS